jgi:transcriptional regulator with XRE-family HTH domain
VTVSDEAVSRNRARQVEWYGEPLGDRFGRLRHHLGLSQAALAEALGLSAPMLSQLISGQRAKIGNPAVLARLVALEEIAADPRRPRWSAVEIQNRLAVVRNQSPTTASLLRVAAPGATAGTVPAPGSPPGPGAGRAELADPVPAIQGLLRAVASADEIAGAAALLDAEYPELAAVLRIYGNGRTAAARAHFAAIAGQLDT